MRYCMAMVGVLVCALLAPLNARANTLTIAPTDDAYVRAQAPSANFGAADFLDSQGGSNSYTCGPDSQQLPGQAYTYLRFDLSDIPAGAEIQSARLVLTSRAGFAFGGDPDQHLRLVSDDNWSESKITFRNLPSGVDQDDLATQTISYEGPVCGDPKGAATLQTFEGNALTETVRAERSTDSRLSLQVFNDNCTECSGSPGQGNWVRFYSKEADNSNFRPKLEVDYATLAAPALYDAVPDDKAGT